MNFREYMLHILRSWKFVYYIIIENYRLLIGKFYISNMELNIKFTFPN